MGYQLAAISLQEFSLKRDWVSVGQAMDIHLLGDWQAKVRKFLADLRAGIESFNAIPQNDEERQEIFASKSRP